jgi:hypothetical protein
MTSSVDAAGDGTNLIISNQNFRQHLEICQAIYDDEDINHKQRQKCQP